MVDTGVRVIDMDRGGSVVSRLHRPSEGDSSKVGGPTNTYIGMRRGNQIQGGGQEDMDILDIGDDRGCALLHYGGVITVGPTHIEGCW